MQGTFAMVVSRLFSAAFIGLEALVIEVEVDLAYQNTTSIRIAGLPDTAVKESKDRVSHAIKNSGFSIDTLSCMVHLAPAEIKKVGAFYDLPIALGILQSLKAFPNQILENYLIGGELGLSGDLRPVCGTLSLALLAKKLGKRGVIVPKENAQEASLVPGLEIIPLQNLREGITFLKSDTIPSYSPPKLTFQARPSLIDMSSIKGQFHAKRALEIAAAGGLNVLMSGPPGTGKTMLAKAFIGILPPLSLEEALEITRIYSLSGNFNSLMEMRPFRAPHHTISYAGMAGGGSYPKPGEISLAHRGVLFLDELPEFSRSTLEVLRQPLEDRIITISRAGGKTHFPTDFICIAAMNPCPCGFLGHPEKPCRDTTAQIERYRHKISGPLLDRMDLHLTIPPVAYDELMSAKPEESSSEIRERVICARERLKNHTMPSPHSLNSACKSLLREATQAMGISARAHQRILKVGHTIAHLSQANLQEEHLIEALSYRSL